MNRPRTPENFPRMKDRAAGRRARRFVAALPGALEAVREVGRIIAEGVGRAFGIIAEAFRGFADALQQASYALAPPPLPPHAAIDDPEGRELVERILERKRAAQGLGSLGLSTPV